MKAITKLVFVALLIAISMNLPSKSHAQSGQLACGAAFGQCQASGQQWLTSCAYGCTMNQPSNTGSYTQCYPNYTVSTNINGTITYNYGQACVTLPASGGSCVSNCANSYTQMLNNCVQAYCTAN